MNQAPINPLVSLQQELDDLQREMMKRRQEKNYDELESLELRVDQLHQELQSLKSRQPDD